MKYSRFLLATLLMSGSLSQLATVALAGGTAAGASIDNTANATYEDLNATGTINTTSNTVRVTVAEVAGITVAGNGITATTVGGNSTISVGNELYYNYIITNTGNGPTTFHIPSVVNIDGPGTVKTSGGTTGLEYSINGGTSWLPVVAGGTDTSAIAVNGSVAVRVAITVNGNPGTKLDVKLGNGVNNTANEGFLNSGLADDVYTIPVSGSTPVNGQRESSDIVSGTVGSTAKNAAFATVLATRTSENQNNSPANLGDDIISYELSLKVNNLAPLTATGITAAALTGTSITTDVSGSSLAANRILVSNAVPDGTKLENTPSTAPGWTKVYTSDLTTIKANSATWTTVYSANATRVGFVSAVGAVIGTNTTVNNFTFAVKVTTPAPVTAGTPPVTTAATTYTVDSIAQAFGSTSGGTDLIYDESGDQTPNNYDPANPTVTSTFSTTTTGTTPVTTYTAGANGVAVATYGIDGNNNNSGTADDGTGEINRYTYTYTPTVTVGLLNGPNGAPDAEGPNGTVNSNEYDFSNKSSGVPANKVAGNGATISPAVVGFINTVKNTGTATANIKLLPEGLAAGDLPNDTEVRIYDDLTSQSATYKITGGTTTQVGTFAFVTGSGNNTAGAVSLGNPVTLNGVGSTLTAQYSVAVTLPAGTLLSTDTLKGYPVVIKAFSGAVSNKTIDRVYTGFVKLEKKSRILQGTGPAVSVANGTLDGTPKTSVAAGNIIEYEITYKNISEPNVGSGNAILKANNLVITEDGTGTIGSNTWGKDANNDGIIDTTNVPSSAADIAGTITYFKGATGASPTAQLTGTTVTTDTTKYVDEVTNVLDPGGNGSFSFKRKMN
jgi:hypothetical protein